MGTSVVVVEEDHVAAARMLQPHVVFRPKILLVGLVVREPNPGVLRGETLDIVDRPGRVQRLANTIHSRSMLSAAMLSRRLSEEPHRIARGRDDRKRRHGRRRSPPPPAPAPLYP